MNKLLLALFAAWALVATALLLRPSAPPPDPVPVSAAPTASPMPVPAPNPVAADLEREVARLRAENTRLGRELAAARARPPAAAAPLAPTGQVVRSLAEATNLAHALAAQIQQALAQQLGGSLFGSTAAQREATYRPLLDRLGLDATRRAAFLNALGEPTPFAALATLDGRPPANPALETLLTDAEYKAWQQFEQALPHREAVQDFDQRLAARGAGLSEAQRNSLTDIFQRNQLARANRVQFSPGPDGAAANSALDQNYNQWDAVVRDARAVLNTAQQEELDRYLGERAEATERLARIVQVQGDGAGASAGRGLEGASVTVISSERTGTQAEIRPVVIQLNADP